MRKKLKKKLPGGQFKNVSPGRSRAMSKIRGKGNKTTEVRFRFSLVQAGIKGWILHPKDITGKPDFYFPEKKVAVFVDGCFWHGCPKCGHVPKTRSEFWKEKIRINRSRDKEVNKELRANGIQVIRFWEHEIRNNLQQCVCDLINNGELTH